MLSSEINLRKNPRLRLLRFNLGLDNEEIRKSHDDVTQWFNSICESVTSTSLVVEVYEFTEDAEICKKIQNTLLVLYERIETFSVYLTPETKSQGLFSKLYEVGIVTEVHFVYGSDEVVSRYTYVSDLLLLSCLASLGLQSMSRHILPFFINYE